MTSQGLLTLGTIPATSEDTPHYPEEREKEGGDRELLITFAHISPLVVVHEEAKSKTEKAGLSL